MNLIDHMFAGIGLCILFILAWKLFPQWIMTEAARGRLAFFSRIRGFRNHSFLNSILTNSLETLLRFFRSLYGFSSSGEIDCRTPNAQL